MAQQQVQPPSPKAKSLKKGLDPISTLRALWASEYEEEDQVQAFRATNEDFMQQQREAEDDDGDDDEEDDDDGSDDDDESDGEEQEEEDEEGLDMQDYDEEDEEDGGEVAVEKSTIRAPRRRPRAA